MKRFLAILAGCLLFCASMSAARQNNVTLRGTVEEVSGTPAAFATAFLSKDDGTVVSGVSVKEDGTFELSAPAGDYILTVSLVGFKEVTRNISLKGTQMTLPVIILSEDSELIGEAVVQAVMPKTKLTGEGLQTSVRGSVLENIGTANDVLERVPGIIKSDKGLEVIGKGAPLIYINGKKVTDSSELYRLQSHEIQSVEVISNPGAQYDATVRSVVRIRTIRRKGEGFGFDAGITDSQSTRKKDNNDISSYLKTNYRKGGVDIFAGADYSEVSGLQESDLWRETFGSPVLRQDGTVDADYETKDLTLNTGFNWQIANNHFTGVKIDWKSSLDLDQKSILDDDIKMDGVLKEHLHSVTNDFYTGKKPYQANVNAYYNGSFGKLSIDVNLDYFASGNTRGSHSNETSTTNDDAVINAASKAKSRLYAGKVVLSYPMGPGMLQFGTEETFSRSSNDYTLSGAAIPASSSEVKEDNIAGFASYGFVLGGRAQVNAGLRYEHVEYRFDDLLGKNDLTRKYDSFFPSLSIAGALGKVQGSLSYSVRTSRPSFSQLDDAIRYNDRFTLQGGNARLQPQIMHSISAAAMYGFFALQANYSHTDDAISTWSRPYNSEGVIISLPTNLDKPLREYSAYVTATPTIGAWHLTGLVGLQGQWLKLDVDDPSQASKKRTISYGGDPIWFAQLNNTFTFKKGWQLELGGSFRSKGRASIVSLCDNSLQTSAAIQKTLLKDGSLVIRLSGSDFFRLENNNITADFGAYQIYQSNVFDTQKVVLSVRYRFNSVKSKYKGTGAGNDARDRMK